METLKQKEQADSSTDALRSVYELTCRTLQMNLHAKPGTQLVELVRETFSFDAVAIFDADLHEVYQAGEWKADPAELLQNVYNFETVDDDHVTGLSRRVVRLGAVAVGSLLLLGHASPLVNSAIAALVAATFDRYHAVANESRIEAERQAEQLRTAVLDNLAHAYKTPLTAIRAASSGLREMGRLSPGQAELVSLIDEQATLLNELTNRLLTSARLGDGSDEGSSKVSVAVAPVSVAPLLDEVASSFEQRSINGTVKIARIDEALVLSCDRQLLSMLLSQYVDNAIKYSDPGTTITLDAVQSDNETVFSVHNLGPVIPIADRERLFERYFRSYSSRSHVAGTGIGLAIAKRMAMAHGGSVWVTSDETDGTTFYAAIPTQRARDCQSENANCR